MTEGVRPRKRPEGVRKTRPQGAKAVNPAPEDTKQTEKVQTQAAGSDVAVAAAKASEPVREQSPQPMKETPKAAPKPEAIVAEKKPETASVPQKKPAEAPAEEEKKSQAEPVRPQVDKKPVETAGQTIPEKQPESVPVARQAAPAPASRSQSAPVSSVSSEKKEPDARSQKTASAGVPRAGKPAEAGTARPTRPSQPGQVRKDPSGQQAGRSQTGIRQGTGTRPSPDGRKPADVRMGQPGTRPGRTLEGTGRTRTSDFVGSRPGMARQAEGSRGPRFGTDSQLSRPGAGRTGMSAGQAGPGRGDSRTQGARPLAPRGAAPRRGGDSFTPELGKNAGAPSRRDRDKNRKKDYDRTNNQGNNRFQGQGNQKGTRPSKTVSKPVAAKPVEKKPEIKEITIPEKLTIAELAAAMKKQASEIIKKLFLRGEIVTVNSEIDFDKAEEIALEYEIIAEKEVPVDVIEELLKEEEDDPEKLVPRPPVVCVMGHVDHGKTSLLDYIRNTHVTKGEAGGITQHIGAYVVSVNGQKITFLDTPGHEAFTAMRMRGANATDIAVLVVAADDGVMPQTVEAISHAKAAGVEIIVAINKIDKPGANVERVKQELTEHGLVAEDYGGQTPMVPVSAHTGEGIDDLLEMILLTAEVSELKADPNRAVRGLVIEAKLDKGKGPVATILVQKGTLRQGDFIAAGACSGKVRAMMDDTGSRLKEAGPSMPVEILGLSDVPNAGEVLMSFKNDKEAKTFADTFVAENKKHLLEETKAKLSLDNLFDQIHASDLKELPIIVKADVQGSVEAVRNSLLKLSNEEVVVKIIHGGVGAVNESDVSLAATSNAIIIGFNVRPTNLAKQLAEQENVDMRLYKVIYQAIEDVESAMRGMLDPVYEEKVIGHAQVRQLFKASGIGTIAGSYVLDGVFQRNCKVRITHEGEQIYEGALASLKRFKDDVKEVRAGYECGLVFEDFNDLHEDDLIEAYIMVEVPR
ncbi:MAG: translation initiation factor IF-2 [Blautia sp.]|nr:translation initiation factor IF-2 [Blautia sp.]